MSVISGLAQTGAGFAASGEAKAASSKQAKMQLYAKNFEEAYFNQWVDMTDPFREQELQIRDQLSQNLMSGPGQFDYAETPGLEGFLAEMDQEFLYAPSTGLQEAIDASNRATERSGLAKGPGGATLSAVARGTAGMTYQDFIGQQARFDSKQLSKGKARAGDYWGSREAHTSEWRSKEIDPYLGFGTPITQQTGSVYSSMVPSMGNALVGAGSAQAAGGYAGANMMNQAGANMAQTGSNVGSILMAMYGTPATSAAGSAATVGAGGAINPANYSVSPGWSLK